MRKRGFRWLPPGDTNDSRETMPPPVLGWPRPTELCDGGRALGPQPKAGVRRDKGSLDHGGGGAPAPGCPVPPVALPAGKDAATGASPPRARPSPRDPRRTRAGSPTTLPTVPLETLSLHINARQDSERPAGRGASGAVCGGGAPPGVAGRRRQGWRGRVPGGPSSGPSPG